ncbi:MAG: sigma-70 family RNA polymerase sigma factor [Armatimonadota bacterium]|nr:sigma-70 family RNA polymerase sigma factor [bacterium]MDW8320388.1 sigma-70 family RNA polymerase sigma factor [Armatimonadota bacterium]
MTSPNDSQLIERCRNGDREAFDELVRRYEKQAYNLAYRLAGNYDDASDVVVEAFVRAFQGLHTFRGDANFGTWLHRVVVNTFLDMRKRTKGRQHLSLEEQIELDGDTFTRQIEDTSPGPQELVEQEEREQMLQRAIAQLPPDRRILIVLYHFENLSYEEIAQMLKLPVGTVKSRLNRARLALREILEPLRELFGR